VEAEIIQLKGANGEKANAWLTMGEVVAVHIDKAMIRDGVYITALAKPIVRAGRRGDYFTVGWGCFHTGTADAEAPPPAALRASASPASGRGEEDAPDCFLCLPTNYLSDRAFRNRIRPFSLSDGSSISFHCRRETPPNPVPSARMRRRLVQARRQPGRQP